MALHTIKGWLYYKEASKYSKTGEPTLYFLPFSPSNTTSDAWGIGIREHSIEVEIPDDFDPRPQQIAALDERIKQARAEFTARINELQEQKSRLLAISMTVEG